MIKPIICLLLLTLRMNGDQEFEKLLDYRKWTSADGKSIEAELLSASDKAIEIKRKSDRRAFEIPLENLSEKDRKLIKKTKSDLLLAAEVYGYSRTQNDAVRRKEGIERLAELEEKKSLLLDPLSFELARRLGILAQIGDNLPSTRPTDGYKTLSLSIDSLVVGGDMGKLSGGKNDKTFLLKSGKIFVRLSSDDTHLLQKGQEVRLPNGKTVASVGKTLKISFPSGSGARGTTSFTGFSVERIGVKEAVIVEVTHH